MIAVHVLLVFASPATTSTLFGEVVEFLGGPPAAPVFVALMGLSAYYSRRQDLRSGIYRGATLILLGYLLNFLRGVVPVGLAQWCAPAVHASIPDEVADLGNAMLTLDILHFAGLSFIAMAFLRHWHISCWILLTLAAVIASVSPWLWGLGGDLPLIGRLLDFLWGHRPTLDDRTLNLVAFPFLPWFSFVLVGMALGDAMTRSSDASRTLLHAGGWGTGLMIASLVVIWHDWDYQVNDYYHCRPGAVAAITGFLLMWLAACQLIVERVPANPLFTLLFTWSRHVNRIYLIQWILVMWVAIFIVGFGHLGLAATACMMVVVIGASDAANRIGLYLWPQKIEPAGRFSI